MSNSLKPYKPDSLWKSIRNKQRKGYAEGLIDAAAILASTTKGDKDDVENAYHAILERYDEVDGQYED